MKNKTLRNKLVNLVKVQRKKQKGSAWTWEPDDEMREHYLDLFTTVEFEGEV